MRTCSKKSLHTLFDKLSEFPLCVTIKKYFISGERFLASDRTINENKGEVSKMEELTQINWALFAPIVVIQIILMITALVDCIRSDQTNGPKLVWIILILLSGMIGPILYFIFGRKR